MMENITGDDLKWLLALLESEPELAELEVAIGDDRVALRAPGALAPVAAPAARPAASPSPGPPAAAEPAVHEGVETLRAPMAGIFYRSPSPEAAPYVEAGDEVHVGDPVGLIEAMKLFNEVTSHLHGRIVQVLVDNEQHVDADMPLVLIEPFHM